MKGKKRTVSDSSGDPFVGEERRKGTRVVRIIARNRRDFHDRTDLPLGTYSDRTMGVFGKPEDDATTNLRALSAFMSLFQHGGRPLNCISHENYRAILSAEQVRAMFRFALTYRPGFLVNSSELAGLVHVPAMEDIVKRRISMDTLNTLAVRAGGATQGTLIGYCACAGTEGEVFIPDRLRTCHDHLVGRPGTGKSRELEHLCLHAIERGHGVAVLDPHGDLAERILCCLPEACLDRVIYFDPGDREWVPLWNPLHLEPGQDASRTADDIVEAIKGIVTGWGDRLEHLLRHAIYGILHLDGATFLDVSNLLNTKTEQTQALRQRIAAAVDNEKSRQFWLDDIKKYRNEDFAPVAHKLSKLLLSDIVSVLFNVV